MGQIVIREERDRVCGDEADCMADPLKIATVSFTLIAAEKPSAIALGCASSFRDGAFQRAVVPNRKLRSRHALAHDETRFDKFKVKSENNTVAGKVDMP